MSYTVLPITEKERDAEFITWLNACGIDFPERFTPGRLPSLDEIRQVLRSLEKTTIQPISPIHEVLIQNIGISDGRTSTELTIWQKHDHSVERFSFRGGGDLVEVVMQQFANTCGTFLVVVNGEDPSFVFPRTPRFVGKGVNQLCQ